MSVFTVSARFVGFADGQGWHRGRGGFREEDGGGTGRVRSLPKKQELLLPQILVFVFRCTGAWIFTPVVGRRAA